MEWKTPFDQATLDAGYEDWIDGCLEEITYEDEGFAAIVNDEEDSYIVHFFLDDDHNLVNVTCSCPLAEEGHRCKHMATAYFQLEEDAGGEPFETWPMDDIEAPPFLDDYDLDDIHFLMEISEPEHLHNFMSFLFVENPSLLKYFWLGAYHTLAAESLDDIKDALQALIDRFEAAHYIAEFYQAEVFINEAIRLYVMGSSMLEEEKDMAGLFDFGYHFMSALDIDLMDDHSDQLEMAAEACLLTWQLALDQSDRQDRQAMVRWYQDWQGEGGEAIELFEDALDHFFRLPAFAGKAGRSMGPPWNLPDPSMGGRAAKDRKPRGKIQALYPQEVLASYERRAEAMAYKAYSRPAYRELVGFLRQIQRIEGGKALVDDLVGRWRYEYKRRYAMQEELDKL